MMEMEKILKRIEAIEDLEAIKNLHRRYLFYVNGHQWDNVLGCFTENATADIGMHGSHQGPEELEDLFKNKIAKVNEKWNGGHFVTQPIISANGATATGYWMMYICVFDAEMAAGPTLKWIQGRHDCEYVKQHGEWKIKFIKYTRPWPEPPKR
jgi:hypothetical protein